VSRTDPLPPPPTGDEPSRPLKIVIADYPTIVRAGIASLLSAQPGMEILAAGATADQCLEALRGLRRQIDVLLLVGLGIPGERGSLWLIRSVRDQFPTVPILACGANADDMTVSQALFTGADGFVSKDVEPEAFVDAVRRAAEGHLVLEGVRRGAGQLGGADCRKR
jgi:DNA-binding NarL/FixJ family response regulator